MRGEIVVTKPPCPAALAATLALWLCAPASAEPLFTDDFTSVAGRYELYGGSVWSFGAGECRFRGAQAEAFAVANVDELGSGPPRRGAPGSSPAREATARAATPGAARIEAEFRVDRRETPGYCMAGLTLFSDPENHWRLLLVVGPEGQRYFELVERYHGLHQAQSSPAHTGMQLSGRHEGSLTQWDYGRPYRLVLSLAADSITGEIQAPGGKEFWRARYSFGQARAVRAGRPGFMAMGLEGRLKHLAVEGSPPAADTLQVKPGRLGSIVLVKDVANLLAPRLEQALTASGFGVRAVSAEELADLRLSARQVDLLLFADARRVPAALAAATVSLLRSGGKVLAIGAPAFGELLLRSPRGYVELARYREAIYDVLARQPLPISAAAWWRSARNPSRRAAIRQEPPAPDLPSGTAWKVTAD